ncbi:hypothetical protein [Caenispirillum bisanense]|uniref:Uncharacterized protein n=1 Tax=Caenispirillum bisanense TaxID=414052 RepID=A0A286GUM9_9PROT|nr:hypothetical protein [Caenispirillum bisanense]SOD99245.1 hypothetical protein SAMN05421508_108269 [Caenispirillum bisanense]
MGDFDTRDLDASTGRMRRVLTLIHDKAPSEQIDPELDEMERGAAALVLRFEASVLSRLAMSLTAVEGGIPLKTDTLLGKWEQVDHVNAVLLDVLKFARRLKSQVKEARLRGRITRFIDVTEKVLADKKRIGSRFREEVKRLGAADTGSAPERQSAILYMAALSRRGVEPKLLDLALEDGIVTPIVGAVPPRHIAEDSAKLLAFEDGIHDEVERAAPHLMGRTVIWWMNADAPA